MVLSTAALATAGAGVATRERTPTKRQRDWKKQAKELEEREARLKGLEAKEAEIPTKLELQKQRLWQDLVAQAEAHAEGQAKTHLQHLLEQLRAKEAHLKGWEEKLAGIVPPLTGQIEALKGEVERIKAEAEAFCKATVEECNERLLEAEAQLNEYRTLKETAEARAEAHWRGFYLKATSNAMQENAVLKKPEKVKGGGYVDVLANQVIEVLAKVGIIVQRPAVKGTPGGFELTFAVAPLRISPAVPGSEDEPKTEALSISQAASLIERHMLDEIKATLWGCQTPPEVEIVYQGIKLSVDLSGIDWSQEEAKVTKGNQIWEPAEKHIFQLLKTSYHLGLYGQTGGGKTVLVDNLLGAMYQELRELAQEEGISEIEVELNVANPKFDADLKKYNPRYLGFEEEMLGLKQCAELVSERLAIHEADYRADRELTAFHSKSIWLFEEITQLAALYNDPKSRTPEATEFLEMQGMPPKNAVGYYLSKIWQLGRALGIMVIIVGQKIMASNIGVNLADLENMGMIYLGKKGVLRGIKERCDSNRNAERYWANQVASRLKEGQKYFAFFCPAQGESYLGSLPEPGKYSLNLGVQPEVAENEARNFDATSESPTNTGMALHATSEEGEDPKGSAENDPKSADATSAQLPRNFSSPVLLDDAEYATFQKRSCETFQKPEKPCSVEGCITSKETGWAKRLWYWEECRNKKDYLKQIWGIGGRNNKDYPAAMKKLQQICEREGIGLRWR